MRRSPRARAQLLIAVVALLIVIIAASAIGPVSIPWLALWSTGLQSIGGPEAIETITSTELAILTQLRLPRVALACVVGALLAGCGATYQGVLGNPLADPYLLGAAAGAGLGAVVGIVFGATWFGGAAIPLLAFAGAMGGVGLSYAIAAGSRQRGITTLILAGVAVSALLSAIQTFLLQRHTDQLREVYSWLLGGLATAGWGTVIVTVSYAVVCLGVVMIARRQLDVLSVGDDEARLLGLDPGRVRLVLIIAASLGTAAAVSASGLIGFVGLVVPHLVRLWAGASYRVIVPISMLLGAALLTGADLVARTVVAPGELPIGVVTAALGAPVFLWLLRKSSWASR